MNIETITIILAISTKDKVRVPIAQKYSSFGIKKYKLASRERDLW
jgi:hypothetical protein